MTHTPFGLSLRGGAIRGLGGIGVIRYFQEKKLQPKIIAGSSSGALLAALYASGASWSEIVDICDSFGLFSLLSLYSILEDNCLFSEKKVRQQLKKLFGNTLVEQLPIKLIVFATSVKLSQRVYLDKGNLVDVLMASMAYPMVIPSQFINQDRLVDGDLTSSFSAEAFHKHGINRVFGVRYLPGVTHGPPHSFAMHVMQVYRLLLRQIHQLNSEKHPVNLEILYNADDISYFHPHQSYRLMMRGYLATKKQEKKILKLLKSVTI